MSSQTRFIRLNSNDKTANSASNSDFYVDLKEKFLLQQVKTVSVHHAIVPNVFYNINSSNNSITFTETTQVEQTVSIPEGQYVLSDLQTQVALAMNTAMVGSVLTITQSSLSKKLIFTYVGNTVALNPASTIAPVLGLISDLGAQAVQTMDYIANLRGLSEVYIHSNTIAQGHLVDGNSGLVSTLCSVPLVGVQFGADALFQSTKEDDDLIIYNRPLDITNIHIVLRDSEGRRLDIGTSVMTIIIKVSF